MTTLSFVVRRASFAEEHRAVPTNVARRTTNGVITYAA